MVYLVDLDFGKELETYSDYTVLSPVLNSTFHVQNVIYLTRNNYTDNNGVKEAIIKYGALDVGYFGQSTFDQANPYFNPETNAQYQVYSAHQWLMVLNDKLWKKQPCHSAHCHEPCDSGQ